MPPLVALIGCVLFVFFLLRQEAKEAVGVTNYLWVPTIWFLILASRSLALWFGTGGMTNEQGSQWDEVVNLALAAIALFTLAKRRFAWSVALRQSRWLIVLLTFMFVSTLWSDAPFVSFRRWVTYVIAGIMIYSVKSEPRPRVAAEHILLRIVYVCIPFSYLTIHYYQEYGRIYVHTQGVEMWVGVSLHKNSLAELCLISFFLISWRIVTREKKIWRTRDGKIILGLDAILLLITLSIFVGPERSITYSATTFISTLVGFGVLGLVRWYKWRGKQPALSFLIFAAGFLIVYGTMTPFMGKLSLLDVSQTLGRGSDLTGRTAVWASLMPAVSAAPLLGAGVAGFWTTQARELYDISGAHNGYLGEILEGGFVGWLLLFILLLSITKAGHRVLRIDPNWGTLCLMCLFGTLTHNIGEESINSPTSRLLSILLMVYCCCFSTAETADVSLPACGTPSLHKLDQNRALVAKKPSSVAIGAGN
jgi:O-antigen ligase